MKYVHVVELEDVVVVDFGPNCGVGNHHGAGLVVIPRELWEMTKKKNLIPHRTECGGYEIFTTRKGRKAVRVLPGTGWTLEWRQDGGDRRWGGYFRRYYVGDAYSCAKATTNGGGCWFELQIYNANSLTWAQEERRKELEGVI